MLEYVHFCNIVDVGVVLQFGYSIRSVSGADVLGWLKARAVFLDL